MTRPMYIRSEFYLHIIKVYALKHSVHYLSGLSQETAEAEAIEYGIHIDESLIGASLSVTITLTP